LHAGSDIVPDAVSHQFANAATQSGADTVPDAISHRIAYAATQSWSEFRADVVADAEPIERADAFTDSQVQGCTGLARSGACTARLYVVLACARRNMRCSVH
jgi:hypothetical protein